MSVIPFFALLLSKLLCLESLQPGRGQRTVAQRKSAIQAHLLFTSFKDVSELVMCSFACDVQRIADEFWCGSIPLGRNSSGGGPFFFRRSEARMCFWGQKVDSEVGCSVHFVRRNFWARTKMTQRTPHVHV